MTPDFGCLFLVLLCLLAFLQGGDDFTQSIKYLSTQNLYSIITAALFNLSGGVFRLLAAGVLLLMPGGGDAFRQDVPDPVQPCAEGIELADDLSDTVVGVGAKQQIGCEGLLDIAPPPGLFIGQMPDELTKF